MQANTSHTAEIIAFPRPNTILTKSPEEIQARLVERKMDSIDDALAFLVPPIFESLTSIGFGVKDDRKAQVVIEGLRAIMYDHYGLHHDLTDFLDKYNEEIEMVFQENEELLEESEASL